MKIQHRRCLHFAAAISLIIFGASSWAADLSLPPNISAEEAQDPLQDAEKFDDLQKNNVLAVINTPSVWQQKEGNQPQLNFLELSGYFRTRANFLYRCDLGTYIQGDGARGTSQCAPPIMNYPEGDVNSADYDNDDHSLFTMDMRLKVDPTLNVSEYLRIKGGIDVFNNLVFGSTPNYMSGTGVANPSVPVSFLSMEQKSPGYYYGMEVTRVWAEAQTAFGEFRFGRMPLHFGLGLLYNNGAGLGDDNPASNIDALMFSTSIAGHYLTPGYSVSYSGPIGRAGGLGANGDFGIHSMPAEGSARFDLDPRDNVNALFLIFGKQHSALATREKIAEGESVWNYGLLTSYRFQHWDSKYVRHAPATNAEYRLSFVERNAHAGVGSAYAGVQFKDLKIEAEFTGSVGRIGNTDDLSWAEGSTKVPVWILQGGAALKSSYSLFNKKLAFGLDAGIASGNPNSKLNSRSGLNPPMFSNANNTLTTFSFNPNYTVDLLLFKQVLGTVAGAYYLKPHVSYEIMPNFTVAGDVISSFAVYSSSTFGDSNILGLEIDLTASYKSTDGFYLAAQYGLLVPFNGLNHPRSISDANYEKYGTAQTAQTVQVFAGISF